MEMSKVMYVALLSALLLFLVFKIRRRIVYVKAKAHSGGESQAVSRAFSFDIFGGLGAIVPLAIFATVSAVFLVILPCFFSAGLDYTSASFYGDYFGEQMGMLCAALGVLDAAIFTLFFWPNFFGVLIFGLIGLLVAALYSLVAGFDPSQMVASSSHFVQNQLTQFIGFLRHR